MSGAIDWADDDGSGLPSIAGLQAKFGTSGTATPVEGLPSGPNPEEPPQTLNGTDTRNETPPQEGDGFTQALSGRGRPSQTLFTCLSCSVAFLSAEEQSLLV